MAQVTIEFSTSLAGERGKLAACVAETLEGALGLRASPSFFHFAEKSVENPTLCVTVQIFPAGSGRQRRAACAQVTRRLSETLGLLPEQIAVRIVSPQQERESYRDEI